MAADNKQRESSAENSRTLPERTTSVSSPFFHHFFSFTSVSFSLFTILFSTFSPHLLYAALPFREAHKIFKMSLSFFSLLVSFLSLFHSVCQWRRGKEENIKGERMSGRDASLIHKTHTHTHLGADTQSYTHLRCWHMHPHTHRP